ncbi:hypothetical protein DFH06DRAFT_1205030 [Mycena polygramma]|nr:hypothetical protein DFH06DRAFT_1205030 [Mycena polygramma]
MSMPTDADVLAIMCKTIKRYKPLLPPVEDEKLWDKLFKDSTARKLNETDGDGQLGLLITKLLIRRFPLADSRVRAQLSELCNRNSTFQDILVRMEVCAPTEHYYKAPGNAFETILSLWMEQETFSPSSFAQWVEDTFGPLIDDAIKLYPPSLTGLPV